MTYIGVPTTTDPDVLSEAALQYLQTNIPGWTPADGNLEVWLIYALAQMVATGRDVASVVPDQIFEYFGSSIMNLPPLAAAAASVQATITVQDNAGYDIPAGTHFGFQHTGSTLVAFATASDTVIAPGSTTAVGVVLNAVLTGPASNGLTGAMTVIDPLAFITSVVATTTSSGGVAAEATAAYLGRLVAELQLIAPRPIIPSDFAVMAQNVSGVYRALAIDGYNPGRTDNGCGTTNLSPVVTDANIVAADQGRAITAAGGVPAGTFIGTVTPGVSFRLSSSATSQVDVNATATGSVNLTFAALTGQARTVAVSAVDSSGAAVSPTVQSNIMSYLQARREVNFIVTYVAPTFTVIAVTYEIAVTAGQNPATIIANVNAALTSALSPGTWGGGGQTPPVWDPTATTVRFLQIARIIEEVAGVAYIVSGSLLLNGAAADVVLSGIAPLPQVGVLAGTHT